MSGVNLDGYNDVASRLQEFREKHPEGSLQPANLAEPFRVVEVDGKTFITYTAAAYRSPDDQRPGIGVAWELVPGKTPYTKDSELQNAETSAWGRAIVAALAADMRKGIATREEVRARGEERPAPEGWESWEEHDDFIGGLRALVRAFPADMKAAAKQAFLEETGGLDPADNASWRLPRTVAEEYGERLEAIEADLNRKAESSNGNGRG